MSVANIQLIKNLRSFRKKHNYTQMQLSKKLNISRQAYSNYETGQRDPDIDTLVRLSHIYHVSLEQLIAYPCGPGSEIHENVTAYTPGMVIDSADTVYLTRGEVSLLMQYREASDDDRTIVRKVLGVTEE